MKKIVLIVVLMMGLAGCSQRDGKLSESSHKNPDQMSLNELNAYFDSLNAEGFACIVKGSDREYDTIIDHIKYRYIKDEGYDTPIDSSKYCRTD